MMERMIQDSSITRWMGCSNECKRRRSQSPGFDMSCLDDMTLGYESSDKEAAQRGRELIFPGQSDVSCKVVMRPGRCCARA